MNRRSFCRTFTLGAAGLWVPGVFALDRRRYLSTSLKGWSAGGVEFDGSSYAKLNESLLSGSSSQTFTFSGWLKCGAASSDTALMVVWRVQTAGANRLSLRRYTNGKLRLDAVNSSGATVVLWYSGTSVVKASGWMHVYVRANLANADDLSWAINGVAEAGTKTTFTTGQTVDYSASTPWILVGTSATTSAADPWTGSQAEMWLSTSDLGASGYSSFRAGSSPAYLGPAGIVGGVTPRVYLSRSSTDPLATWYGNRGAVGGTFTQGGTPAIDFTTVAK